MADVEIINLEAENAGSSIANGDCPSNGHRLQTSHQQLLLRSKIKSLNKRVIRYDFLISEINAKILELGEQDLSVDDLNCEKTLYTKIAKLQENVLKARVARNKLKSMIKSLQCKQQVDHQTVEDREESCSRPVEKLLRFSGSGHETIDQAITRHINRYKSASSSSSFTQCYDLSQKFYNIPSFHDIFKIVRRQNAVKKLGLNVSEVYALSQSTGNKVLLLLKKYTVAERKQFVDDWDHSSQNSDPSLNNTELAKKLAENKRVAYTESKKLTTDSDLTDVETNSMQSWLKGESTEPNSAFDSNVPEESVEQKAVKMETIITITDTENDRNPEPQPSTESALEKSKKKRVEIIDLSIDD